MLHCLFPCCDPEADDGHNGLHQDEYTRVLYSAAAASPAIQTMMSSRGSSDEVFTETISAISVSCTNSNLDRDSINIQSPHNNGLLVRDDSDTNENRDDDNDNDDDDDDDDNGVTDCCRRRNASVHNNDNKNNNAVASPSWTSMEDKEKANNAIHDFLRRLGERWNHHETYDSFESISAAVASANANNSSARSSSLGLPYFDLIQNSQDEDDNNNSIENDRLSSSSRNNTLHRTVAFSSSKKIPIGDSDVKGKSFHDSVQILSPARRYSERTTSNGSNIPTISPAEVVIPGSLLQKEMAQKMLQVLQQQKEEEHAALYRNNDRNPDNQSHHNLDECVICMEGFDETNPRMPTLCGCGENKTYFHLPCLYQWVEQSDDCPTCRQPLTWEEF